MDPEEGVKGLASKIRARELDVPNRIRAIRYLGTADCRVFPEAKEMLLKQLDPEVEKWEEVRFEAAQALKVMLARNSCCNGASDGSGGACQQCQQGQPCQSCQQGQACQQCQSCQGVAACCDGACDSCTDTGCDSGCDSGSMSFWQKCTKVAGKAGKSAKKGARAVAQRAGLGAEENDTRPCHCKTCCDAETMNTLARTAYELKPDGCCYEPSRRVREMVVEVLSVCGVPCNYAPYYATGNEQGPSPVEVQGQGNTGGGEDIPPVLNEDTPTGGVGAGSTQVIIPGQQDLTAVAPISRLVDLCIVSLKQGEKKNTDRQISSVYRGRLYYFSSLDAKQEFDASPESYAVAFGGCDPVHFVETRQAVEGRFLTQHEGRFYMFATRENADAFNANPGKFTGQKAESSKLTAAR